MYTIYRLVALVCFAICAAHAAAARPFNFRRDTFAFANETVFEYHDGNASLRHDGSDVTTKRFVQHCFVMSRSVVQFRKFARFDPSQPPLEDAELAALIRKITRTSTWDAPLPERDRIVIPGYSDLRTLSRQRGEIVRNNIGKGWPTYFRPGNWRIFLPHGAAQQARTQLDVERALSQREGFFVAYLTTIPKSFSINHAVLIYGKKTPTRRHNANPIRYIVYDPNHSDLPRTLEWLPRDRTFSYERDTDFVGGPVIVWQVYGQPLQ